MTTTSKQKGDLLEDIVALITGVIGFRVETRIKIPSIYDGAKRKREIDVLLTSDLNGYPIRIAIECKNEENKVGIDKIDAFVGKLADVGIPTSHGIYVTPTGYTGPALEHAMDIGCLPLELSGLTADRLSHAINDALQSIVYLVAIWQSMDLLPYVAGEGHPGEQFIVVEVDRLDDPKPAELLNEVWRHWISGHLPTTLGEHFIFLRPNDQQSSSIAIVTLRVFGLLASIPGTQKNFTLRHAKTKSLEGARLEVEFAPVSAPLTLTPITDDAEIQTIAEDPKTTILHRVRVPRLISEATFWPPTLEAIQRIRELRDSGQEVSFATVEGKDLSRAFEYYVRSSQERRS